MIFSRQLALKIKSLKFLAELIVRKLFGTIKTNLPSGFKNFKECSIKA